MAAQANSEHTVGGDKLINEAKHMAFYPSVNNCLSCCVSDFVKLRAYTRLHEGYFEQNIPFFCFHHLYLYHHVASVVKL